MASDSCVGTSGSQAFVGAKTEEDRAFPAAAADASAYGHHSIGPGAFRTALDACEAGAAFAAEAEALVAALPKQSMTLRPAAANLPPTSS